MKNALNKLLTSNCDIKTVTKSHCSYSDMIKSENRGLELERTNQ